MIGADEKIGYGLPHSSASDGTNSGAARRISEPSRALRREKNALRLDDNRRVRGGARGVTNVLQRRRGYGAAVGFGGGGGTPAPAVDDCRVRSSH
jgi:hypothetical protein